MFEDIPRCCGWKVGVHGTWASSWNMAFCGREGVKFVGVNLVGVRGDDGEQDEEDVDSGVENTEQGLFHNNWLEWLSELIEGRDTMLTWGLVWFTEWWEEGDWAVVTSFDESSGRMSDTPEHSLIIDSALKEKADRVEDDPVMRTSVNDSIYSMAFCSVLTFDSLLFRFSKGTDFLSRANAELTAWTLLLSLAFLRATKWAGFSRWGICLYWGFDFVSDDDLSVADFLLDLK